MNNIEIDDILLKSIDDLYIDLYDFDDTSLERDIESPKDKQIKEGKKRFNNLLKDIQTVICKSEFFEEINKETTEKQLVIAVFDALLSLSTSINFPVMTVSGLVVKLGIDRICRNT